MKTNCRKFLEFSQGILMTNVGVVVFSVVVVVFVVVLVAIRKRMIWGYVF